MKKLILLSIAIVFANCEQKYTIQNKNQAVSGNTTFQIIIIDNCEYIAYHFCQNDGLLTHKGNCTYCLNRNKK